MVLRNEPHPQHVHPTGRLAAADVRIRPYSDSDVPAIVDLALRAWEPVFGSVESTLGSDIFRKLHTDWRANHRQSVEEAVAAKSTATWVADTGERVVGFAIGLLHRRTAIGELLMLAVDTAHQNGGIGALLTTQAVDWMKEAGMTLAMVETGGEPSQIAARRTYEKAGFTLLPIARYFMAL